MSAFDTLNAAEAAALRLLAEGHSVKSAADVLGSTENAVNERLREARRKTGIGSSRELARAFAAQENRDRKSGIAFPSVPPAAGQGASPPARRLLKGLPPMLILAAVLAAVLAQPPADPAPPIDDPLVVTLLRAADHAPAAALHRRLRTEARDTGWADAMEPALIRRFDERLNRASGVTMLRVTCGATLCELAGEIDGGGDRFGRLAVAIQQFLGSRDVRRMGLRFESFTIGATPERAPTGTFLGYLTRE